MRTLKQEAQEYTPPQTKNISELDKVPIDLEIFEGDATDKDGNPFKYKYILFDNEKYRVPLTVLGQIKTILEKKPETKFVSVTKSGEGVKTTYQVLPED